jgi:N-acetylmuramoyl-L-alanine amidase CwlA
MNINRQYVSDKNTYNRTNAKKYIVIHETDNFDKGADALRHAKAQYNGNLSTSVHFYCGSDGIYQVAELDKSTWSIGRTYKEDRPIMDATNYNTINIEICVNEDGDYEVARQNAIDLVKYLMKELNLSADRVIRHYDAKGKYCPRAMMDNPELWTSFKAAIEGKTETTTQTTTQNSSVETPFLIKVDKVEKGDVLNIRKEPNANAEITGKLAYNDPNTYTIIEVKNGWGRLKSGIGWINLHYTKNVVGKVTTTQTPVPPPTTNYYKAFNSTSIVDGLKSIGVDSSKSNRKKIAKANGISNYTGTASQNTKLLSLAKQGKLIKP